jgi:hypothetical protein
VSAPVPIWQQALALRAQQPKRRPSHRRRSGDGLGGNVDVRHFREHAYVVLVAEGERMVFKISEAFR